MTTAYPSWIITETTDDRPTLGLEIIGASVARPRPRATEGDDEGGREFFGPPRKRSRGASLRRRGRGGQGEVLQRGGCGGFGLGNNFKALFRVDREVRERAPRGTRKRQWVELFLVERLRSLGTIPRFEDRSRIFLV